LADYPPAGSDRASTVTVRRSPFRRPPAPSLAPTRRVGDRSFTVSRLYSRSRWR